MKRMNFLWCLAMLGLLTMGSCQDKKEKKTETKAEQAEEQKESEDEGQTATFDEPADEPVDDEIDEEAELTPEQLEAYENEVWKSLGGLYGFVGEGYEWIGLETGISEDDEKWLSLAGEQYPVKIDYETGLIRAYDDSGKLVFEGYCTKGGNMLRGKLWGKDVKFEGACGQ